jgi:hypothetical protein
MILPSEKPNNTIGRPAAVSFRNVLDGILYVFEIYQELDVNIRCCLKNMALDQPVIDDFSSGLHLKYFKNYGLDC